MTDASRPATAPRTLVQAEFNIVLEDLKHAGVSPRTLKTLLPAMWRGLEAGTPSDQWGLDADQTGAYAALQARLSSYGVALHVPARNEAAGAQPVAPSAPVTHIKWRSPFDEFSGIARIVGNLLAHDPDLAPQDVCVVAPNSMWAYLLKTELERKRISVQSVLDADVIAGDPRIPARLGTLEVYAFLALANDPQDVFAWRFWLALGDPGFACAPWAALEAWAAERGLAVRAALEDLDSCETPPFAGAERLAQRALDAEELLARTQGKTGFALRNALCRKFTSPQVKDLFEYFEGNEDVAALLGGLQARSYSPTFVDRPSQVRLGSYKTVRGISARHVLLPGLVDGVVPAPPAAGLDPAGAEQAREAQRRAFADAVALARDSLVICHFQHIGTEQAAQLRLPVRRTRNLKGTDVAVFSRSPFIDEAGDALPGSVSGEQFFSDAQEAAQ